MRRPLVVCARCGQQRPHSGRGLCNSCYCVCRLHGTLDDYPRRFRRGAELVEDYRFLVATTGATRRQAAERLGVTVKALEKAIERHGRAVA